MFDARLLPSTDSATKTSGAPPGRLYIPELSQNYIEEPIVAMSQSMPSHHQQPDERGTDGAQEVLDSLVAEARQGSVAALNRLIEAVATHLSEDLGYRERQRGTTPSRGTSDLLQETLLRLREHFGQFERDRFTDLVRWARVLRQNLGRASARNRSARYSERHMRRVMEALLERKRSDPDFVPPASRLERREAIDRAFSILRTLKVHEQFILDLRLMKNMTFKEIAQTTGSTDEAVCKAYHRALKRLQTRYLAHEHA